MAAGGSGDKGLKLIGGGELSKLAASDSFDRPCFLLTACRLLPTAYCFVP